MHRTTTFAIAFGLAGATMTAMAAFADQLYPLQARQLEYCNMYKTAKAKGDRARMSTALIFYNEVTAQLSHTPYPSVCRIP